MHVVWFYSFQTLKIAILVHYKNIFLSAINKMDFGVVNIQEGSGKVF